MMMLEKARPGDQFGVVLHHLGHRDMLVAAADQIAVDLIRDNPEVVLLDDLGDAGQLLLSPHPAGGVLGVAPEDQLALGVGTLGLEILVVQFKGAILSFLQGRVERFDVGVLGRVEEITVSRRIDEHLFVRVMPGEKHSSSSGNSQS